MAPASRSMRARPIMPEPPTPIKWTRFPWKRGLAESGGAEREVASMLFIIVQRGLVTCHTKGRWRGKKLLSGWMRSYCGEDVRG
jgi:hypothetical protein